MSEENNNLSQTPMPETPVTVSADGTAAVAPKRGFLHKIFGSTPGDGEMQPKEGLSFSICGFGQNLICTIVGSYLTVFMTDAIGFSALSVALLMLFARIYDAANDPIMGSIVDRTRTPWGKCRPYLKWMAIPIMIMTILCFLPWYPNNAGGFAAVTIVYLIWGMVYTVADVPYWGLSTAMSNDTYRRGNMLTIARLFCTLGAGLVTIIVPMITSNMTAGLEPAAASDKLKYIYFVAAIVCCVIALPLFFVGFKNTQERNQTIENPPSLGHNLKLLFKNKPLLLIVLSGIGGAARMLFTYTGGLYFAKYVMADAGFWIIPGKVGFFGEALYTVFTMAVVPGGLIASLLVPYFTKKAGKRNTYIWSHVIGGVAMLIAFIVGIATDKGNYTGIATIVCLIIALVIAGIPQGFGNIITYAMIGDTVEYLELTTGERAEGICFAMQTLINKIGMAVGAFVGVLAYYLAHLEANNPSAMTPGDKDTMWIILMLVAAISFFLTVIPLFFYKFNEKEQQEAVAEITRRKAEAAAKAGEDSLEAVPTDALAEKGFAPMIIFPNEDSEAVPIEVEEQEGQTPEAEPDETAQQERPQEEESGEEPGEEPEEQAPQGQLQTEQTKDEPKGDPEE